MMTAAAIRMIMSRRSVKNSHKGIPQHLLRGSDSSPRSLADGRALCCKFEDHGIALELLDPPLEPLDPVGVASPGGGNEARMSEREPDLLLSEACACGASSSKKLRPSLLAVRPRSRFDATLVALRMRSGRLVRLPRASASRTASTLSLGGRLEPTLCTLHKDRNPADHFDQIRCLLCWVDHDQLPTEIRQPLALYPNTVKTQALQSHDTFTKSL